ncbi:MAG: hypothetical protein H6Q67_2205 [Firmicutes bacterium]|nr:hypothetical protein [Bacillota bacterium]
MFGGDIVISFTFHNPVRLFFGCGELKKIGKLTKEQGDKALLVTSGSSKRTGLLQKVIEYIHNAGVELVVFDKIQANPLTTVVAEGAALAKNTQCKVVIGLGGGSSMDAAKAIALIVKNEGDIVDYTLGKAGNGALPLILVSTTAGTGSEGNNVSVLTNPETNDKRGLKSPFLYAKASIVDPEVLLTLPRHSIAGPGLDALFHSIEAFVAKRSNSMTEIMALKAISLLAQNLPVVYSDSSNLKAWEKVAFASMLGGMAIGGSGTTLPHALEHPVSGKYNAPHGEGLAALYVAIMNFSYRSNPEKFATIAMLLGENIEGLSSEQAAAKSVDGVAKLMRKVGMTPNLRDFGVKEDDVNWLTDNAIATMKFAIENNPQVPSIAQIKEIYLQSL